MADALLGSTTVENYGSASESNELLSRSSHWWSWYDELTRSHPVVVKALTAFFILGLADVCAQSIEHLKNHDTDTSISWLRSLQFALLGLFGGPWGHYYFYYLDYWFPDNGISASTFQKVFIDQFIQAPLVLAVIISSLSLLRFTGWEGVKHDLKTTYWPSLLANWKLWIPVSLFNQAIIPPHLKVLFVNAVFFGWIVILSIILNGSIEK